MARRSVSTTTSSSVPADTSHPVSRRVFTVANFVSMVRLAGVPLFVYLMVAHRYGAALIVLAVGASTDWVDGQLARRMNQVTRLGQVLDPITDRAYIVVTVCALTVYQVVPWQLTAVLVVRELVLAASIPALWYYRFHLPQVHYLGKTATFVLMFSFPLLLFATLGDWEAAVARPLGWAAALWGAALYWYAGVLYWIQVVQLVREERAERR